ncbi:hypothetical protein N657DRAFT_663079 [Parathielavia appendiculata]|uniref:P-loop containing nucleoside triphosphate hydrolase n=1 Tax=Parathielavia appendiculata TaxID=2587402 RepID=A0AAN6Z4Q2_9PEZI|nr:hypothetical protein N657DRAFT_663079 [Parathielavia appendiculata]
MGSKAGFVSSPSSHDSGQKKKKGRKPTSLFKHTNKTFVSKPVELASPSASSISGTGVSSFTFKAPRPDGIPKSPAATPKLDSSALPTFNLTGLRYPRDTGRRMPSDSSSLSQAMDSLTSSMTSLKIPGERRDRRSNKGSAASLSTTSSSSLSARRTYQTRGEEDDTAEESSREEMSAKSGLTSDEDSVLNVHLGLLERCPELDELNEIKTTPIFTEAVRKYALSLAGANNEKPFSQYGLLAGDLSGNAEERPDPRIFWNVATPSSFFICGSQGSGKSHSLSCLLENALAPCDANVLPRPLTGIVFHYDTFISDSGGSPCEVAWLSSNPDIKVRVLCPPTNVRTMQKIYKQFPNITVEELRLNESDLNTKRMLDLMAVAAGGNLPLYLHVAQRILRDLRVTQQKTDTGFSYTAFKRSLALENLTDMQLAPLKQRLETLESFMVEDQAKAYNMFASGQLRQKTKKYAAAEGTSWTPKNGHLTIVDLSCPCVTPEMACSLFNICLSLFLEQDSAAVGLIIALDEAHKYMTDSQECAALTEALLATIRLQRHLGARVVISTQEPTISPKLLDLCSVTIVHRFTSPDWLNVLRKHLAGVSSGGKLLEKARRLNTGDEEGDNGVDGAGALALGDADPALELFSRIVDLRVGEALMFAPSAIVGVKKRKDGKGEVKRLAHGVLKVRIRSRTTADGGRSIMAA